MLCEGSRWSGREEEEEEEEEEQSEEEDDGEKASCFGQSVGVSGHSSITSNMVQLNRWHPITEYHSADDIGIHDCRLLPARGVLNPSFERNSIDVVM